MPCFFSHILNSFVCTWFVLMWLQHNSDTISHYGSFTMQRWKNKNCLFLIVLKWVSACLNCVIKFTVSCPCSVGLSTLLPVPSYPCSVWLSALRQAIYAIFNTRLSALGLAICTPSGYPRCYQLPEIRTRFGYPRCYLYSVICTVLRDRLSVLDYPCQYLQCYP